MSIYAAYRQKPLNFIELGTDISSGSFTLSPLAWSNPVLVVFNRSSPGNYGKVIVQYNDEITTGYSFNIVRVFDSYTPLVMIPIRHEYVTIGISQVSPTLYVDAYVYDWLGKEVVTI